MHSGLHFVFNPAIVVGTVFFLSVLAPMRLTADPDRLLFEEGWESVELAPGSETRDPAEFPAGWTALTREPAVVNPGPGSAFWTDSSPFAAPAGGDHALLLEGVNTGIYRLSGDAVQEAASRARAGEGPAFIECKTYRYDSHIVGGRNLCHATTRSSEELETWKKRDPIQLFQQKLLILILFL